MAKRNIERKKKEQESAEAISGLKMLMLNSPCYFLYFIVRSQQILY